ncbi:alpha-N-acetylneuraminide alpha-2,8-sialyltransferase isoform X2 [Pipistrellus kuhlii]|uniref:alpha-N-acetylneuraminide alpha-2,8-sialyltransferase isoform X2 n=1 Tax=Pipistrellus kuhlii TaxID=59472 RepID=UPI001E272D6F|nr:alpha-N-acetylneuraminide alpha-2,8-sialyltransferase isoform X2 [Pipistrellus kuhlii]
MSFDLLVSSIFPCQGKLITFSIIRVSGNSLHLLSEKLPQTICFSRLFWSTADYDDIKKSCCIPPCCENLCVGETTHSKQMEDCCDPAHLFAMTKMNSPMGTSMWYDGEFLYSFTVDNSTYSLFPQATPFQLPLKKCAVVGNGGILKKSGCGRQIDEANFVMRCNLPPLSSEYTKDVGSKSHLVTANPSIIRQRFQNLLWSRKTFVDNMKIYNHSYIYMPAFSMKTGTEPSLRVYYTLSDVGANQTVLFANPNFLRSIGKFWKSRGIHAKRLSTGLFLVSAALGLCEEVAIYGFWPFSVNMHEQPISHHYYDNVLPFSGFHAMPEEFLQLWYLHKIGALRMQLDPCEDTSLQLTS